MVDDTGRRLLDVELPARGHAVAIDTEQRRAAVFARRPGEFVWIVDLHTGQVLQRINAAPGRHFYGHGLFTADGALLLCSENAYASGVGVIGLYDAQGDYRRVGELPSHGVGPHEIRMLADGRSLLVANGGIRTHPDLPRIKSNLTSMRPNLAYLDLASGELLHRCEPDKRWHQLSIRHIDVAASGRMAVAMQFEGPPQLLPPLIAIQQADGPLQMLSAPPEIQRRLRNYCGSVAFSDDGERFAVSSPRGGVVTYWSAAGDYLGLHEQTDACGISRAIGGSGDFFVSDGGGELVHVNDRLVVSERRAFSNWCWDNHLSTLVGPIKDSLRFDTG